MTKRISNPAPPVANKPPYTGPLFVPSGTVDAFSINQTVTRSSVPRAYRLAKRDGELVLQGLFIEWDGCQNAHEIWEDIPIVNLDEVQHD